METKNDQSEFKIGELTGLVAAFSSRIDGMHSDNSKRYEELLTHISDIKAQTHEIKHGQNEQAQKVIILEERTKSYRERSDAQHESMFEAIEEIKKEIVVNRNTSIAKFEELFSIKNKVVGIMIIIVIVISVFGRDVTDIVKHLWK